MGPEWPGIDSVPLCAVTVLLRNGQREREIEKVCYKNWPARIISRRRRARDNYPGPEGTRTLAETKPGAREGNEVCAKSRPPGSSCILTPEI